MCKFLVMTWIHTPHRFLPARFKIGSAHDTLSHHILNSNFIGINKQYHCAFLCQWCNLNFLGGHTSANFDDLPKTPIFPVFWSKVYQKCTINVHFWCSFTPKVYQKCTKSVPKMYTFGAVYIKVYQKCTKSVPKLYTFGAFYIKSVPKVYQNNTHCAPFCL